MRLQLDLLVEDTVILEFKCVERIASIHEAQLLTYMKLAEKASRFHHQLQCSSLEIWYRAKSFMTCCSPCLRASVVNEFVPP